MAFATDKPPLGGARCKLCEIVKLASYPAHALVNEIFDKGFICSQRGFYNHRAVGVNGDLNRLSFGVTQVEGNGLAGIREGAVPALRASGRSSLFG